MMTSIVRLNSERLNERLDAIYYQPLFLDNEDRLKNSSIKTSRLKNLVKEGRRSIYFSTETLEIDEAPDDWVPFLTADDFGEDGFFINLNARRRVSPKFADQYPKGQLRGNELLVKVKGPNQITAYNDTPPTNRVLVSGTIWGGLVKKEQVDPHYLVSVLSCPYAVTARSRLRTNLNVEFLAPDDLLNLELPIPAIREAQIYIGDKVRLAERLRERSQKIETEVKQFFSIPYWNEEKVGMYRSYRTKSAIIHPERLDTAFYDPAHINLEKVLYRNRAIPLSKLANQVKKIWNKDSHIFYYLEIGEINLGNGSIAPKILFTKDAPSRAKLLVKPWDILVSTVRPNRKNIALVSDVDLDIPIVASTGFSVLRFKSKAETVFYHCWLRYDAATQQLMRWNAGGSYPAIDDDIAISTLVPQYPDKIVEEQGKRWLIKFIGEDLSICLTTAAKLLVEALIEGKLTEEELKTAQEAVQKGDREPDKSILSRLTRKGYDIKDEPPLFPDLDLLYETIDKLSADEQSE